MITMARFSLCPTLRSVAATCTRFRSFLFRFVVRGVGEHARIRDRRRDLGDADGYGHTLRPEGGEVMGSDHRPDVLGNLFGDLQVRSHQDDEQFLTAKAHGDVAAPQPRPQGAGDTL